MLPPVTIYAAIFCLVSLLGLQSPSVEVKFWLDAYGLLFPITVGLMVSTWLLIVLIWLLLSLLFMQQSLFVFLLVKLMTVQLLVVLRHVW